MQTPSLTPSDLVKSIEAEASSRGLSIDDLCRKASLNRATWQRLKAKMTEAPRLDTYRKLEGMLAEVKAMPKPDRAA